MLDAMPPKLHGGLIGTVMGFNFSSMQGRFSLYPASLRPDQLHGRDLRPAEELE
jgi:hypothetical protein